MIDREDKAALKNTPFPWNLMDLAQPDDEEGVPVEYTPAGIRRLMEAVLTEKERQILELRFRDGKTLDETGKVFGVTRERIRQQEEKAFRKLQNKARYGRYAAVPAEDLKAEKRARRKAEKELEALLDALRAFASLPGHPFRFDEEQRMLATRETVSVHEMDFSVRTLNSLQRGGINTLDDLLAVSQEDLMHIRNLGRKSLAEVIDTVHRYGYRMSWEREGG